MGNAVPASDMAIAVIESLTHEGHGVAHIDGKAVFIHGALPGERVMFRYYNKRAKFDTGVVVEVLESAAERIAQPRCPHFGVCGGCSLQHFSAAGQLAAKQKILLDNLAHIGKVQAQEILPPVSGPVWHYRRKARLGARLVPKKGGVLVGFREKRSSYITNLGSCAVLDEKISALLPALRDLIASLSCAAQIPQIEVAVGDDAAMLILRNLVPLDAADRARVIAFAQAHALRMGIQPSGPASIEMLWPLGAVAPLTYNLPEEDLSFEFGATDFVQVNAAVNRAAVQLALQLLAPTREERILDLFCGLGNFSLPLARHAGFVMGVEAEAAMVEKARANATRNALTNVEFIAADLYAGDAALAGLLWSQAPWDKMLLDPPRTGAIEVLKGLPANAPARILYISCNPATLARDAQLLVHVQGYRLLKAGVLDMFPQTTHVESIALFERP